MTGIRTKNFAKLCAWFISAKAATACAPEPECSEGERQCIDNGQAARYCTSHYEDCESCNGDRCHPSVCEVWEWSTPEQCPLGCLNGECVSDDT